MSTKDKFILKQVSTERARQRQLWGDQSHPAEKWVSLLTEELGEVAKAANERDREEYVKELIQVAALAVAAVEAYNRVDIYGNIGRKPMPGVSTRAS